jgi:small GTP-binding protein
MSKTYDMQFKVLVIGDSACGKTSTILRYTNDTFSTTFITTIGIDFKVKYLIRDKKKIKLIIWDTAGQERFRTITTSYFRGANALLVLYSVDSRTSFESIKYWIAQIYENVQKPYFILVANKIDIADDLHVVSSEEGQNLAKKYKIPFYEISAKKGTNVNNAFDDVCSELYKRYMSSSPLVKPTNLDPPCPKTTKKCCN